MNCDFNRDELADMGAALLYRARYEDRVLMDKINKLLAKEYEGVKE